LKPDELQRYYPFQYLSDAIGSKMGRPYTFERSNFVADDKPVMIEDFLKDGTPF
jgi:hypothetical protein